MRAETPERKKTQYSTTSSTFLCSYMEPSHEYENLKHRIGAATLALSTRDQTILSLYCILIFFHSISICGLLSHILIHNKINIWCNKQGLVRRIEHIYQPLPLEYVVLYSCSTIIEFSRITLSLIL